jgi:cell division protein FtsB
MMVELSAIALLFVILFFVLPKRGGFKEIERQHALRKSITKLQEKNQRFS